MDTPPTPSDLHTLLEENLKLSRETHEMVKKVRRYMAIQRAVSLFYLLLIIVPVILAILYLPPFIRPMFEQYQSLMQMFSSSPSADDITPNTLPSGLNNIKPEDLQKFLNNAAPYLK